MILKGLEKLRSVMMMPRMNLNVAVLLVILLSLPVFPQDGKPDLTGLGWISGCWEINNPAKKVLISEQWMAPVGNAMIGMSRTVRGGKMEGFEYLRIIQDGTAIFYISRPSENGEETAFKLINWAATEVTFENPTHDFPQRIIYRFDKGNIFARIEGNRKGKFIGIDFPMTSARCGP
jgi:hypothetical protein